MKKERYFVAKEGQGWGCHSVSFKDLAQAMDIFFQYKSGIRRFTGGKGEVFLAKEIGYKLEPNLENGNINIIPVGDLKSDKPYYLIRDYVGYEEHEDWHDVRRGDDIASLLNNAGGIPKLGKEYHLVHGLELKIEVKSK